MNAGRPAEARALTGRWAASRPGDPRPHVEHAFVLARTGDPAGAERSLKQALAAKPDDAVALANLADLLPADGAGGGGRAGRRRGEAQRLERAGALTLSPDL